jgi:hypothetical protein
LLGNGSSQTAGSYWPGYFFVDTSTPGKEWVAEYRRNQKLRAMALSKKEPGAPAHQGIRGMAMTR